MDNKIYIFGEVGRKSMLICIVCLFAAAAILLVLNFIFGVIFGVLSIMLFIVGVFFLLYAALAPYSIEASEQTATVKTQLGITVKTYDWSELTRIEFNSALYRVVPPVRLICLCFNGAQAPPIASFMVLLFSRNIIFLYPRRESMEQIKYYLRSMYDEDSEIWAEWEESIAKSGNAK